MFHSDKKAIASDAADNVEVHPLATSEGGDGDGEGLVDDWPTNQIKAPNLNTLFSNSDRFLSLSDLFGDFFGYQCLSCSHTVCQKCYSFSLDII